MIDFIYYKKAGKGRAERAKQKIEKRLKELNIPHAFHQTQEAGDATRIARELCLSGATSVVAIGGDGTVHEVLNGLTCLDKIAFGIIPAGTGNDFAAAVGLPLNPLKALDVILSAQPSPMDFFDCGGVRGMNIVGTGIDVDILIKYSKAKFFKGKIQYLFSLIYCLAHFKPYEMTLIKDDGSAQKKSTFIACACNGKRFGGGIKMCPSAIPGDGMLNVIIVNSMPKWQIPWVFMKLMLGKIQKDKHSENAKVKSVRLDGSYPVQIDGEIYTGVPFDVKIISGELKMLLPQKR